MPGTLLDHFRAHARVPLSSGLSVSQLGSTVPQEVKLVDLGLGGASFEVAESFEPGLRLRLELELPGLWDRLTLHGEVAWTGPGTEGLTRVGVRFTKPSGKSLRILAENLVGA